MKHLVACCLVAGALILHSVQSVAADPLNITAVNTRTGVVTARDTTTNRTLQFRVPLSQLRSLKIGQAVQADYRAKKVTVEGIRTPYAIINVRPAEPLGDATAPAQSTIETKPAEPAGEPQATSQAMSSAAANSPLGGKRSLAPVRAGRATENPGRGECADKGGEWRCTTVSTGSDPGPGDDLLSCVCINR